MIENRDVDTVYNHLRKIIGDKDVVIIGPKLETFDFARKVIISVDGTTSILIKNRIVPDIIVTDLDGIVSDQIFATDMGSIAVIHAHGDNITQLKRWIPEFEGEILGTTQSCPLPNVYNFGGFTDGDRAVCIAKHFGASSITLYGFEFTDVVPKSVKHGKMKLKLKRKKLRWAKKLIELLDKNIVIT
jgi:hypothetical protein